MARLLVVDDEEKIRLIIRKYAEMEGHQVTEAKDGIEAVSICALEDFDVIILDVMMPGMDGFAVCKQVRRYKKIPVIMLSARGEEYDRIKGFELGVDDYVVKPFSPKELMCRVRVVVQRNSVSGTAYIKSALQSSAQAGQSEKSQDIEDSLTDRKVYRHGDLVVDFTGRSVMIKVDKEHRRSFNGSGLGLAIVRKILELHNAQYGVDSTLGQGSTFWFCLKVSDE